MDQSASKLAEHQAAARADASRQTEAAQQSDRDTTRAADARADKAADDRRGEAHDAAAEKSGGEQSSNAEAKPASDTSQAARAHGNSHHHHLSAHAEKTTAKAVHAKKAAGEPGEADTKTAKAKGAAAATDSAAAAANASAAATAVPLTPQGAPGAASADSTTAAEAAAKGASPEATNGVKAAVDPLQAKLTNETLASDAAGGVAAGPGAALGMKHALGAHGKGAIDSTAGTKLIQSAREDAVKADALSADTAKAGAMAMTPEATFASALHAAGADQQQSGAQGDASRRQGESSASSKVDGAGAAGIAGMVSAGAAGATHQAAEAPPPSQLIFGTPITSPEFAQALGVSITNLTADGVQQAQLHMNPVETGPIQIQITLDGTQAQVDFQAANASTRDAITAGMPELAAALNAAGLTLTGGGVSEQSRGRGGDAEGGQRQAGFSAGPRAIGSELAAARPAQMVSRQPRGAVDLYA